MRLTFKLVLTLAMALFFSGAALASGKRTVIITTDAGCDIDDQATIMHALLSPGLDVAGIVTTHAPNLAGNDIPLVDSSGNKMTPSQVTADQVKKVLDVLPKQAVKAVYIGSAMPLASKTIPLNNDGVKFILETSKNFSSDQRLAILSLGAATDIASALILDPSLQDRIEVVAIGFDAWPKGKDGFNVANDVKAWQILMDSEVPLTVADGVVTTRCLAVDSAKGKEIFSPYGPAGAYLDDLLENWLKRNPNLATSTTGKLAWPIWDEAALAYLLGYTKTTLYPRPVLNDDTTLDHLRSPNLVRWITDIDATKLWKDLDDKLSSVTRSTSLLGKSL